MSDLPRFMVGPRGESIDLLRDLILVALERHSAWRRRFHPDDVLPAADASRHQPDIDNFVARAHQLLDELLSMEERAFPRSSPRHLGHMRTDLLVPGLAGYIASLLFNQNIIASESMEMERDIEGEVISLLGKMIGFSARPRAGPRRTSVLGRHGQQSLLAVVGQESEKLAAGAQNLDRT